jgi:hypothetical protein
VRISSPGTWTEDLQRLQAPTKLFEDWLREFTPTGGGYVDEGTLIIPSRSRTTSKGTTISSWISSLCMTQTLFSRRYYGQKHILTVEADGEGESSNLLSPSPTGLT